MSGTITGVSVMDCPVTPVAGMPKILVTATNVEAVSSFVMPLSFDMFLSVLIVFTVPFPLNTTSEWESNVPM